MVILTSELLIEVTRRCNMCCKHCLRGNAQDMDISDDVLEDIAKYIQPDLVTFSGGEPSLNIRAINKYFELAEKYHHMPSAFYVITNGKENQEELAIELLRAFPKMDEQDMCGVAISRDVFHDKFVPESRILSGLSFYRESHRHPLGEKNPQWVINEGRARTTGYGVREPEYISESVERIVDSYDVTERGVYVNIVDILYVGANGLVADRCDVSYDNLDRNAICHIKDLPAEIEKVLSTKDMSV